MDSQAVPPELEKPDRSMNAMRFTGKPPGSRARVIDHPMELFSEPDTRSTVLAEVAIGCEVALGQIKKVGDTKWIETTLPSGLKGYIPGASRVLLTQKVMLVDKSAEMHAEPSAQSPVIAQFKKDAEFFIIDIVRRSDGDWCMIRTRSGCEGFIEQKTRIMVVDLNPQDLPVPAGQESASIAPHQQSYDWFIEINDSAGDKQIYGVNEISLLAEKILRGEYRRNTPVVTHARKSYDGQWNQTKSTLIKLAKDYFVLRVLYQPVMAYAVEGRKWGFNIGVALAILSVLRLFIVSHISLPMFLSTANIMPAILVALVGGVIGYLLGMAVGGIIGLSKRKSIQLAMDAVPEPENVILKVVVLPFLGGCLLIASYFLVIAP